MRGNGLFRLGEVQRPIFHVAIGLFLYCVVASSPAQLATPQLTGPDNADGQFSVSWTRTAPVDISRLDEQVPGEQWREVYKGLNNSRSFTKADGQYRYRVRTCVATDDPTIAYKEVCSAYSPTLTVTVHNTVYVVDEGRTVVSTFNIFSKRYPDLDFDGLADRWEDRVASLTRPDVRLDEEEDWLNHPEHHVVDFVRVVGLINSCSPAPAVAEPEGVTPGPQLLGPSNSQGSFTLSWKAIPDFAELQEWNCGLGWRRIYKGTAGSRQLNRPDGVYSFRLRNCVSKDGQAQSVCSKWSPTHSVSVDNPASLGFVVVIHAFAWSRDYGRFTFFDHNGDVEVVAMLWEIVGENRVELRLFYTSAHAGEANDHSGVWHATGRTCNIGSISDLSKNTVDWESMCIDGPQYSNGRLRVRASEDKHAFYPSKAVCEQVTIGKEVGVSVGEDCGEGPMLGVSRSLRVINVGENWPDGTGRLVDALSAVPELGGVFGGESVWSGTSFCGGLGGSGCPASIGEKLSPPPRLLGAAEFCCARPGAYPRVCEGFFGCLMDRFRSAIPIFRTER